MRPMSTWTILVAILMLLLSAHGAQAIQCLDVSGFYDESGADAAAQERLRLQQQIIEEEFPFSREQAVQHLQEAFPWMEKGRIDSWMEEGNVFCAHNGKEVRYFELLAKNMGFRNFDIIRKEIADSGAFSPFFDQVYQYVFPHKGSGFPYKFWQPYVGPVEYMVSFSLPVPKKILSESGILKVWMPLPIQTASQRARLVSISPEKHLKARPRLDAEIGYAFFEVPLEEVQEDLEFSATFMLRAYQQQFQVEPEDVRPYDSDSEEYREYTRPGGSIAVTPEIAAAAKEAANGEKNPYLAARNIYRHILDTVFYSFMPHSTLMLLNRPESVVVHNRRYGDCGSQSMYFAAMCRALGIPARATGGYQLVPRLAGTHFWAEVYIEGYGWLPVDPTVADTSDWSGAVSEEERKIYKDYYFGNLDPFRLVIQRDVDLPLIPRATGNIFTDTRPLLVLQTPYVQCEGCPLEADGKLLQNLEHFSWDVQVVNH